MKQHFLLIDAETWQAIHDSVHRARWKHPTFPKSTGGKLKVLLEEVCELVWACAVQGRERTREELKDVCAVVVRWMAGD